MMKVYVILSKSFYQDARGIDYQIADYGEVPCVFTSLARAKKSMDRHKDTRINMFNERIISDYPNGRESAPFLVQEFTTMDDKTGVRTIVSLYLTYTD